jgi:hypothetical protein
MSFYSLDGTVKEGSALHRWATHIAGGVQTLGMDPSPGSKLKGWIQEAGFCNINHLLLPLPCGTWPKEQKFVRSACSLSDFLVNRLSEQKQMGLLNLSNFLENAVGLSARILLTVCGWQESKMQLLLAEVRKELKDRSIHPLHDL